jgi:hypothetical protein
MDVESKTQLADVTAQTIKELLGMLTDTKAFVLAQAPDIFQQAIRWQIAQTILSLVGLTVFTILFFWLVRRLSTVLADQEACRQNKEVPWLVAMLACGVITIILLIGSCIDVFTSVKAIVAPKLFLLDYVKGLLK